MQVGDLGYAADLGNDAEYSGAPKEEEVLHYARVLLDVGSLSTNSFCMFLLLKTKYQSKDACLSLAVCHSQS